MLYVTDSGGNKSASLTLALISFVLTATWYALSVFETVGGIPIRQFDSPAALAFMSPCLALYFGRRKVQSDSNATTTDVEESK